MLHVIPERPTPVDVVRERLSGVSEALVPCEPQVEQNHGNAEAGEFPGKGQAVSELVVRVPRNRDPGVDPLPPCARFSNYGTSAGRLPLALAAFRY